VWFALQLLVSLALLALLVRVVPVREARGVLARVRPGTLAGAVALALVGYWGRARRWSLLLERSGVVIRPATSYRLTLVGTFYGLVTPGRVGEFARILHVRAPRAATLPSVVWDRVADVLILELLCVPAFALVPAWRGPLLAAWLGVVAVTLVGVLLLASKSVARASARALPVLARPIARWAEVSRQLLGRGASAASFGWGAFFYVFTAAAAWLLLRDLSPGVSPRLLLGLPVIPLLGNLPVAFGGLGLREQVSVAVFAQFGVGAATGAVFSLLWFAVVTLLPGLLGFAAGALSPVGASPRPGGGA